METAVITLHYLLCFFLIIVILLQAGKGADIGAVFGGASQTLFGSRGPATFLSKLTAFVAMAFLATSIWLAHISKTRSIESVLDKAPVTETAPAQAPAAAEEPPAKDAAAAQTPQAKETPPAAPAPKAKKRKK
jgi:preprotein translocase subunit SecG